MSTISGFSNDNAQAVQANRPQGQTPPPPRQDAPNNFEINDRYTPSNGAENTENPTYGNFARSQMASQASAATISTMSLSAEDTSSVATIADTVVESDTAQNLEEVVTDIVEDEQSSDTTTSLSAQSFTSLGSLTSSSTSSSGGIDVSEFVTRYDELYASTDSSNNTALYSSNLLTTQAELDSFKDSILANIETQNKSLEIFNRMYAGEEISDDDNTYLFTNNQVMYGFAASHLLSQEDNNTDTEVDTETDTEVDTDIDVDTDTNADTSTDTTTDVEDTTNADATA